MENKKKFINNIVIVVAVIVLIVCIVKLGLIFYEYKAGSDEYSSLQKYVTEVADSNMGSGTVNTETETESVKNVNFDELRDINSDIVAWIEIDGTDISYPVVQTEDNDYYLNHTFGGEDNKVGSIFIDYINSSDFADLNTFIYGHNMKDGSMFGKLSYFKTDGYADSHETITIYTPDNTAVYEIFSFYVVDANSDTYTIFYAHDEAYQNYLNNIVSYSMYDLGVGVSVDDSIITLSTCANDYDNARFVVHAKKIS